MTYTITINGKRWGGVYKSLASADKALVRLMSAARALGVSYPDFNKAVCVKCSDGREL